MRRIVVRRLAQIIPLIFAVIVLNFVLIHLAPGSLFDVMTAEQQITDPAKVDCRPLQVLLMPKPWHRGRVVLIGDAVHASTPQLAMGAHRANRPGSLARS